MCSDPAGSRAARIYATLLSPVLLIALLGVAGGVGWGAGRLLHRHSTGMLLPDILQGMCGAALCLEAYSAAGPLEHGIGEVVTVSLIGAWVWVGVAHATAAVLRRLESGRDSGQT
jgi:hypothetical protein